MEYSIQELNKAGAIPDLIIFAISTDFRGLDRVNLLSMPEIECVEKYFELLVEHGECEIDDLSDAQDTLKKLAKRKT